MRAHGLGTIFYSPYSSSLLMQPYHFPCIVEGTLDLKEEIHRVSQLPAWEWMAAGGQGPLPEPT